VCAEANEIDVSVHWRQREILVHSHDDAQQHADDQIKGPDHHIEAVNIFHGTLPIVLICGLRASRSLFLESMLTEGI
jgi:hypothetical protein